MQVDVKGLSHQEIEQIADHYSHIYGLKVWKGVGLEIQGSKHFLKKGSNDVIFVGKYNKRLPVESGKEVMKQVFGMQDYKFEIGDTFEVYFPHDDEPEWWRVTVTHRTPNSRQFLFEDGEVELYRLSQIKRFRIKNYKSKTGMKNWVKITEPSDIKKYPVGTKVRVNGVETEIVSVNTYINSNDWLFETDSRFFDRRQNLSFVFDTDDWEDTNSSIEVLVETPVSDIPTPDKPVEQDMVKNPNHYQLLPEHGLEVKDVLKAVLNKIEQSDFDMNLYEAGWYQQSMQYFLRFCDKNGVQDLEKGVQTMGFVLESIKERTLEV